MTKEQIEKRRAYYREYNKKYYKDNREKLSEYHREYHIKKEKEMNPDKIIKRKKRPSDQVEGLKYDIELLKIKIDSMLNEITNKEQEIIEIENYRIKEKELENEIKEKQILKDQEIKKNNIKSIKRLSYLFKNNQANEVDYYRVADLHIDLFGYTNKLDSLPVHKQVNLMLNDLVYYLSVGTKIDI